VFELCQACNKRRCRTGSWSQGLSRKQFEAIQPDFGRMHAASTDGSVFAVALTVQADEEGAAILTNM